MKLQWHTFGGGIGAPADKNSYQAVTGGLNGREMYLIDPRTHSDGSFNSYMLRYFGPRGYEQLEMNTRYRSLMKAAQAHHDAQDNIGHNPLSAHAAAIMGNPSRRKRKATAAESRKFFDALAAEREREYMERSAPSAKQRNAEMLAAMRARKNPARRDMENRIAVQFHAHGVWATVKTFPNTVAGRKAAKAYATKAIKKIPHTFRAIAINQ